MAQPPRAAGNGDNFVRQVVADPKNVPDVMLLYGYLGASSEEGHERLYLSPDLSSYVEVPTGSILHRAQSAADQDPLGGVTLWVRKDAALKYKMAPAAQAAQQALAAYFAGALAGAAGQAGAQAGIAALAQPQTIARTCLPHASCGCTVQRTPCPEVSCGIACTPACPTHVTCGCTAPRTPCPDASCGIACTPACPTQPRATCAFGCTFAGICRPTLAAHCTQLPDCPRPQVAGAAIGGGVTPPVSGAVCSAACSGACPTADPNCGITAYATCDPGCWASFDATCYPDCGQTASPDCGPTAVGFTCNPACWVTQYGATCAATCDVTCAPACGVTRHGTCNVLCYISRNVECYITRNPNQCQIASAVNCPPPQSIACGFSAACGAGGGGPVEQAAFRASAGYPCSYLCTYGAVCRTPGCPI